jgi:hypothetical protein
MATLRKFRAVLYPAHLSTSGFRCFSFDICGGTYPTRTFEAAGLGDALSIVASFAVSHGQPCYVSLHCLSKPKPPGFDAAADKLYFNMDKAAVKA